MSHFWKAVTKICSHYSNTALASCLSLICATLAKASEWTCHCWELICWKKNVARWSSSQLKGDNSIGC